MSDLKQQLKDEIKNAMRTKDTFKRDTLRFLMNSVKQIEVDERKVLTDADVLKLIQKNVKQREDAISQFREGGRDDLADKEQQEADLLRTYLPTPLNDDELQTILSGIITQTGASSMKDMGKVIGMATKAVDGKADGKRINEMVKSLLA